MKTLERDIDPWISYRSAVEGAVRLATDLSRREKEATQSLEDDNRSFALPNNATKRPQLQDKPESNLVSDRLWYTLHDNDYDDFPKSPAEFSDAQIECIAHWRGQGERQAIGDTPAERTLINEYDLDEELGEATWPAFSAVLRARKNAWMLANPDLGKQKQALESLEATIIAETVARNAVHNAKEACLSAGLGLRVVRRKARLYSEAWNS